MFTVKIFNLFFFGLFKFLFTLDDNILAQSDSMSKSIFGTKIIYTLIQTIKKNISTLNVRMNSTYRIYNGLDEVLHANKNIKTFRAHNSIDAIRFVTRWRLNFAHVNQKSDVNRSSCLCVVPHSASEISERKCKSRVAHRSASRIWRTA